MSQFLDLIEAYNAEDASREKLFAGEGSGIRHIQRRPDYEQRFNEALGFVADVFDGKKPVWRLQEAMGTDDFPLYFADVLDRQMLGIYREYPSNWRSFVKVNDVRDFRTVKRFAIDGSEGVLDTVKAQAQYPESSLSETKYEYSVQKKGRRLPIDWESMVNDDLGALRDIPRRFGVAARRSEAKFVTELYIDASGPHASLYATANANIVHTDHGASSDNPVLGAAGLQDAMKVLHGQVDSDGEPIFFENLFLVVPPALEPTAMNLLSARDLELNETGGSTNTKLVSANWLTQRITLVVDPYIPIVASTANGATTWAMFGSPSIGRPALEMGFLRGHEAPEMFIKSSNQLRVGGGGLTDGLAGDFDTDSIQYKVRHVFGGTRMEAKSTVASNGSAS